MRGHFIALEGIEGSGKTTQAKLLGDQLRRLGHDPLMVREPGGTPFAEQVRNLLLHEPYELNAASDPTSLKHNVIVGFSSLYRDADNNTTFATVAAMEADLTAEAIPAQINRGPETVANVAAISFADASSSDYSLTASTPAAIVDGGLDAYLAQCGLDGAQSCGAVDDDRLGVSRSCPALGTDCYAVGAFEP